MQKVCGFVAAACLLSAPAQAREWTGQTTGRHTGAFAGAQFKLLFHGPKVERPRASLGVAPALSRVSSNGVHTTIGEGLAMSFSPGAKPSLTLAGVRADRAFGLTRNGRAPTKDKLGVSTGGWIAIGVGSALVVSAVGLRLMLDHYADCEERDC